MFKSVFVTLFSIIELKTTFGINLHDLFTDLEGFGESET